jgi:hypothetical protein
VTVAQTSIPLTRQDVLHETPEFICIQPMASIDFSEVPDIHVPIIAPSVPLEYNPPTLERYMRNKKMPRLVQEVDNIVDVKQRDIKNAGWTPPAGNTNAGIFGNQVHEWVSGHYQNDRRFLVNVFLDTETGDVLSIGQAPPGGTTGTTQIDLIAVKGKYRPKFGEPLDRSKLLHVFDIKTSARLSIRDLKPFMQRVYDLTGHHELHMPQVRERWSFKHNTWTPNTRASRYAVLGKLFGAFTVVSSLAELGDVNAKADVCIANIVHYRTMMLALQPTSVTDPAKKDVYDSLRDFMQSFSQGPIFDFPVNATLYKWLLEDPEASIFDYDSEYDDPL